MIMTIRNREQIPPPAARHATTRGDMTQYAMWTQQRGSVVEEEQEEEAQEDLHQRKHHQ